MVRSRAPGVFRSFVAMSPFGDKLRSAHMPLTERLWAARRSAEGPHLLLASRQWSAQKLPVRLGGQASRKLTFSSAGDSAPSRGILRNRAKLDFRSHYEGRR